MFTDLIRRIQAGERHLDPADALSGAGRRQLQQVVEERAQARRTLVPPDADNAEGATPQGTDER